ncbi:Putrescine-binding periplasmic protein precursor [compost metagenome]
MNEILEPRVSADFTTTVGYSTAVPGAKEFLPKDVVTNRAIFPSEEDRKKMFWQSKLTPSEQRMMTRAWSKFKSGL